MSNNDLEERNNPGNGEGEGEEFTPLPLDEHTPPPADAPDGSARTAMEEYEAAVEEQEEGAEPPRLDSGMEAGYPLMRDEDLPPGPGEPEAEMELPTKKSKRGSPLFSEAAFELPGIEGPEADEDAAVQVEEQTAKAEMVEHFVTDPRIDDLWTRADEAHERVESIQPTPSIAKTMLDQIKYTRNEIMGGRDRYEEAERYINEVEYKLAFITTMRRWSNRYGPWLFVYEFLWGVGLMLVLFLFLRESAFAGEVKVHLSKTIYLLASMVWGGFGGVISALYALILHIAQRQDFDKQHLVWYYYSPIMGIGMGAVVYLIMQVGLLSLVGTEGKIASPIIIYVLAFLCGYQHNVFTDLIKRVLKVFEVEEAAEEEEETSPKPPAEEEPAEPPEPVEEK